MNEVAEVGYVLAGKGVGLGEKGAELQLGS
jgi:hypothetical protein